MLSFEKGTFFLILRLLLRSYLSRCKFHQLKRFTIFGHHTNVQFLQTISLFYFRIGKCFSSAHNAVRHKPMPIKNKQKMEGFDGFYNKKNGSKLVFLYKFDIEYWKCLKRDDNDWWCARRHHYGKSWRL